MKPICAWMFALGMLFVASCGSAIVGGECREGFTVCNGRCVDTNSNPLHCGACGNRCDFGLVCISGECRTDPDAGDLDGGFGDGSIFDSSNPPLDGQVGDGGVGDGGMGDGGVSCACDIGEICCDDVCVSPNVDPRNCGRCGLICGAGTVCSSGSCEPLCAPPTTFCSGFCVDTSNSPDNCGGCGRNCASGLCQDGMCIAASAGHVVLIGHSYDNTRAGMNLLVSNSVGIATSSPIEALVYEGDASARSISNINANLGAGVNRTVASDAGQVPLLLADADVFLVYSQQGSNDSTLTMLGRQWSTALASFLLRGGVVMVFDGGGSHSGTYQILDAAGLLSVSGRTDVSGDTMSVVTASDAVASGVPLNYLGEITTVRFDTTESIVVVSHPEGPVVIHRIVAP